MDAEALRKTKEHYNSHANLHEDREQVSSMQTAPFIDFPPPCTPQGCDLPDAVVTQALQARRQGKALPLKDFHNAIKRKMINRCDCNAEQHLMCCMDARSPKCRPSGE